MSEQLSYFQRMQKIKLGLLPKEAVPKPKKRIAPISEKKKKELKEAKDVVTGETELVKWFKLQMRMMPQYCEETGLKLENGIYKYAIMSICHILPKSTCNSLFLAISGGKFG